MSLEFGIVFILLWILQVVYFKIADKFNIIDKPNQRSSHTQITLRGGGIIFPLAFFIWFVLSGFELSYLALAILLISSISFADDILTLSTKPRLAVHFVSVVLVLYQLGFVGFPWWGWVLGFVLIIGWLNNFNFMDGINGITVLYALSVFIPLYWTNSQLDILPSDLLVFVGFSLMIFGFYNLRKKARTFSGDVGSISLGLLIAFCIATLIIATHNWQYILWVVIYGLDSVITIIERLLRRENIFEAHRSHLYQYLANEMKVPHVVVSMIYAVLQLAISALVMYMLDNEYGSGYYVALFVSLGILYLLVKKSIKSKINIE